METNKHPSEIIQELDYEISQLESEVNTKQYKLTKLKERKQSLLNYLNSDDLTNLQP